MKILLINLPSEGKTNDFTTPDYLLTDFMRYPPLGLLAIATLVDKKKHNLKVLDVIAKNMDIVRTIKYIFDYKPDILGITVVTRYLYAFYEIIRRVKNTLKDTIIVAGGPHVNYFPEETMRLNYVDYALVGFGEKKFPSLVEALDRKDDSIFSIPNLYYKKNNNILHTKIVEDPINLDDLPFIDRTLVDLSDYFTAADKVKMTTMYSSRGCPFRCIFCDVQEKKFHFKSAKRVVDEFEYILGLGIKEIFIFDDTFNLLRERVIDICKEIIKRRLKVRWSARARVYPFDREMAYLLKKSGCCRLHVGVEALDDELLKYMRKGITLEHIRSFFKICNEFKLSTVPYFILGFPKETEEYRKSLYKNILKLKPTYIYINILCPLPKTDYYESLLNEGVYKEDFWKDFIRNPTRDFKIPLPRSAQLQDELMTLADSFHRRFFLQPKFILKEFIRSLPHPHMLFLKIKIAILLLIKTIFLKKRYA